MKTKSQIFRSVSHVDKSFKETAFAAMQEYADQQLAEYKAKLKEVINKANYLGQVSKNNIVNTIDTTVI